jgi:hypothetical protein
MVKCCGFVEFRSELRKRHKKVEICKKISTKCRVFFLSSGDFPSLMLRVGSVKVEPQWEKYPNLSVRSFVTSKKPILGFYFVTKTVHIYVAFLLALITL